MSITLTCSKPLWCENALRASLPSGTGAFTSGYSSEIPSDKSTLEYFYTRSCFFKLCTQSLVNGPQQPLGQP